MPKNISSICLRCSTEMRRGRRNNSDAEEQLEVKPHFIVARKHAKICVVCSDKNREYKTMKKYFEEINYDQKIQVKVILSIVVFLINRKHKQ